MSRPRSCRKRPSPQVPRNAKRCRLRGGVESPWASMDPDLLRLVASRALANDLVDYVRLRATCAHWRSATVSPRGCGITDRRFHPRRWMMLPEGHGLHPGHYRLRGDVRFFNLSTGAFATAKLPLFRDHMVLDSVDGLLVLQRDHDTAIRLLHPFTGDVAELPLLETLRPQLDKRDDAPVLWSTNEAKHRLTFLRSGCAAVSVNAAGAITVMLFFDQLRRLAFATAGDRQWTLSSCNLLACQSTLASQGKLYMVKSDYGLTGEAQILQIDPPKPKHDDVEAGSSCSLEAELVPKLIATFPTDKLLRPFFLAECGSQILLLGHDRTPPRLRLPSAHNNNERHEHILVCRLADLASGRLSPVANIGDHALFVGQRSLFVSPKVIPAVFSSENSVFFTPRSGWCLSQYHLSSQTWSPIIDGTSPPPSPYSIVHHILTCCNRQQWNKGVIVDKKVRHVWRVKRHWRSGG